MKELTFGTMIAVFEEMFGPALFWILVALAVAITIAFIYVVIRDRRLEGRRLLRAELLAPVGAIAAIWFVFAITESGFGDMGGPIDVITLIGIGLAGAIGLTILAYVVQALVSRRGRRPETGAA